MVTLIPKYLKYSRVDVTSTVCTWEPGYRLCLYLDDKEINDHTLAYIKFNEKNAHVRFYMITCMAISYAIIYIHVQNKK